MADRKATDGTEPSRSTAEVVVLSDVKDPPEDLRAQLSTGPNPEKDGGPTGLVRLSFLRGQRATRATVAALACTLRLHSRLNLANDRRQRLPLAFFSPTPQPPLLPAFSAVCRGC